MTQLPNTDVQRGSSFTGEDRGIGIDFSRFFGNGDSTTPSFAFKVKELGVVTAGTIDCSSELNDYFVFLCSPG